MRYILIFLLMVSTAWASEAVLIGDSLTCGPFGNEVFEHLKIRNEQVTLYCAVSSSPAHWVLGKNPSRQKCYTRNQDQSQPTFCSGNGKMITLSKIMAKHPNARFVIALGTNSLLDDKADSYYSKFLNLVLETSSACQWIGPPHINPAQAKGFSVARLQTLEHNLAPFYESLLTLTTSKCPLVDSRPFTVEGTPGFETIDGVHRGDEAGKFWADGISDQL